MTVSPKSETSLSSFQIVMFLRRSQSRSIDSHYGNPPPIYKTIFFRVHKPTLDILTWLKI